MKTIDMSKYTVIRHGVEFHIERHKKSTKVDDLLPHFERNENYVYWLQPSGGNVEEQEACICIDGTFYTLNSKLEKAIFRNVRLTRNFKNYERLVDGRIKLVIPRRLFQEKLKTSKRVSMISMIFMTFMTTPHMRDCVCTIFWMLIM